MRYLGSKAKTASAIQVHAARLLGRPIEGATVCDPFGGLGVVASAFKVAGWRVSVGDHLLFPYYYQVARLASSRPPRFRVLISHLGLDDLLDLEEYVQQLPGYSGWFVDQYALRRQFFSVPNARRIEAAWLMFQRWRVEGLISPKEYAFGIASLVESFDRVANTAGTYYAYLKSMTRRAQQRFEFQFLTPVPGLYGAKCQHVDATQMVATKHFDVLYLDPPYSARVYDRYYHLPKTIATGQRTELIGISGVPSEPPVRSNFESPRRAEQAFAALVDAARCSVLMVHYADGGLLDLKRIRSILQARGRVAETHLDAIGYTTRSRPRTIDHTLFTMTHE
jgi:adenine-specific DNA-methyltransferase